MPSLNAIRKTWFIQLFLLLLLPGVVNAAAGRFLFVAGDVQVIDAQAQERKAVKGMEVNEGDTVRTARRGSAQIRLSDGTFLAVRPRTELRIAEYAYKEPDREERSFFSLVKGTFRSITGKIGKENRDNYRVTTPVATIGIRGTDHEPAHFTQAPPGGQAGTYDKVNSGGSFMETQGGRANIGPGQVGFVRSANSKPTLLPQLPAFYSAPTANGGNGDAEEGDEAGGDGEKSDGGEGESAEGGDEGGSEGGDDAGATEGGDDAGTTEGGDDAGTTEGGDAGTADTGDTGGTALTGDGEAGDQFGAPAGTDIVTDDGGSSDTGETIDLIGGGEVLGAGGEVLVTLDGSAPTTPAITYKTPTPGYVVAVGWPVFDASGYRVNVHDLYEEEDHPRFDGAGQLIGWDQDWDDIDSVTIPGYTSAVAGDSAATGISWGYYAPTSIDYTYTGGSTYSETGVPLLHWIKGPGAGPVYLTQALTSTVSFSLDGGPTLKDTFGRTGSLTSATLTANFATQTVGLGMVASIGPSTWTVAGSNIPMEWGGFHAWDGDPISPLTITYDDGTSGPVAAHGGVGGIFTGSGLTGAALGFGFASFDDSLMNYVATGGSAALAATSTVSTSIPNRLVAYASYDPRSSANSQYRPSVIGAGFTASSRLGTDASGNITGFDSEVPYYWNDGMFDHDEWLSVQMALGGAAVTDAGSYALGGDATQTIRWGRWEGSFTTASRSGADLTGGDGGAFNPARLHYIAGQEATTEIQIPSTGTFTYNKVGGTNPTDNLANVGTLNSASLSANFDTMTVNAALNATVASTTYTASATGMPIQGGRYFDADGYTDPYDTHGSLNLTCSGAQCGSVTSGELAGALVGDKAQGAGIIYSIYSGNNPAASPTQTIQGVIAFERAP